MSKTYCPRCGHLVNDNDIFCSNCGYKLKANNQSKLNIISISKPRFIIIIVILLLMLISGGYYDFSQSIHILNTVDNSSNFNYSKSVSSGIFRNIKNINNIAQGTINSGKSDNQLSTYFVHGSHNSSCVKLYKWIKYKKVMHEKMYITILPINNIAKFKYLNADYKIKYKFIRSHSRIIQEYKYHTKFKRVNNKLKIISYNCKLIFTHKY